MSRATRRQEAALELRTAALAREVIPLLADAGVRPIVLKGPAIRQWLYERSEQRGSVDLDLLVAPSDFERAERILRDAGFDAEAHGWSTDAHGLRRPSGEAVDLHQSLPGVGVTPDVAWGLLSADTAPLIIAGVEAECLPVSARALHLSLHARQHPEAPKPREDLERGLAILEQPTWREAAALANELHAADAFSAGLRGAERGAQLAEDLGLPPPEMGTPRALSGPGVTLERILSARGWRERIRRAAWHAAPPPAYLRSWTPLARRGRIGLLLAYLLRPFLILGRMAPAAMKYTLTQRAMSRARRGRKT